MQNHSFEDITAPHVYLSFVHIKGELETVADKGIKKMLQIHSGMSLSYKKRCKGMICMEPRVLTYSLPHSKRKNNT